jgi:histidine ammonia-lyase
MPDPRSAAEVVIGRAPLARADYEAVVYAGARVRASTERLARHRRALEHRLDEGAVVYGVNTGFGGEVTRAIPPERVREVQAATITSSAQGIGAPLPPVVVRGAMLLKAQAHAQGPPAVRPALVDAMTAMLNANVSPVVPTIGSTSCADLVQQAHIGMALIGHADVVRDGVMCTLAEAGLEPIVLAAKEGGSLVNDASVTVARAIHAQRRAERLIRIADEIAAMTLEALGGHPSAFDERLVRWRPHPGALATAAHLRTLLAGTHLAARGSRPHDPYSLRCLPQVHGTARDALATLDAVLDVEIGSIGDNPIALEDGTALSGGNFHGAPLGVPLDAAALATADVAALAQARVHQLLHPLPDCDLPHKLAVDPEAGLGLLMLDTLALGLLAEARVSARPASLESGRVDQMEDHLAMAGLAAQGLDVVVDIAERVLMVELACASQALDFAGVERAAPATRELHAKVRQRLAFADSERRIDVETLRPLVAHADG